MRMRARSVRTDEAVADPQGGAAYVEFLMSFIPLFIMFLGMVQMALMYAGDLVVQHSATTAARAAVVVLDDDPALYEGAQRRRFDAAMVSSGESAIGAVVSLFGGGGGGGGLGGGGMPSGGPRLSAVRMAASIPLLAISPSFEQLVRSESVEDAIGSPETRAATGALVYNNAAMGVTFPASPGGTSYRTSFDHGDQVTARVTYLFHCGVPVVSRMMCESYPTIRLGPAAALVEGIVSDIADGDLSFDEAMARLGRVDDARRRHERDEDAINELETAGGDDLMYLTWATGARFKVLRAEATMPLQSARFLYPSE